MSEQKMEGPVHDPSAYVSVDSFPERDLSLELFLRNNASLFQDQKLRVLDQARSNPHKMCCRHSVSCHHHGRAWIRARQRM